MAKLEWQNVTPMDSSRYLDAIARAQKTTQEGIGQVGTAFQGYYDTLKENNTNEMLTLLNGAKNQEELGIAQQQIAALQQKYGNGYDLTQVRNAMDTRPDVLMQRQTNQMAFDDLQKAQTARPMMNAMNIERMRSLGMSPEAIQQAELLSANGGDNSAFFNTQLGYGANDRSYNYEVQRDGVKDRQWQMNYDRGVVEGDRNYNLQVTNATLNAANTIADNQEATQVGYDSLGRQVVTSGGNKLAGAIPMASSLYGDLAGVRGIRNNNPGNLGFAGQRGASRENGNGRFASFNTPEEGIAAMSKQLDLHFTGKSLKAKEAGRPLQTVSDIIHAWAPPNENNTSQYIADVSKQLGVSATTKLNLNDPNTKAKLMQAIVHKENGGNPYSPEQYMAGITGKHTKSGSLSSNGNSSAGILPQSIVAKIQGDYNSKKLDWSNKQSVKDPVYDPSRFGSLKVEGDSRKWLRTDNFDVLDHLKSNPTAQKLSQEELQTVLDRVSNWRKDSGGPLTYISAAGLKKQTNDTIAHVARTASANRAKEHEASNPLKQARMELQQAYRAAGLQPPSDAVATKMLDMDHYNKVFAPKEAKKAVSSVANKAASTKPATVTPTQVKQVQAKSVSVGVPPLLARSNSTEAFPHLSAANRKADNEQKAKEAAKAKAELAKRNAEQKATKAKQELAAKRAKFKEDSAKALRAKAEREQREATKKMQEELKKRQAKLQTKNINGLWNS